MSKHFAAALLALAACLAPAAAGETVRHEMTIELDPATHTLKVEDRVRLPGDASGEVEFLLNAALSITTSEPPVERVPLGEVSAPFGINAGDLDGSVELARYRVKSPSAGETLTLRYAGVIDYGLSDPKEEYTRGFRETAGVIGEEGVYLAGGGVWYPRFDEGLVEFRLEIAIPADWHAISQGNGSSRNDAGRAVWDSGGPMDEIYLVGGPLVAYREAAGAVEALVYLREPDDGLAGKYLSTTAQYIEMYRELIGPYPYGKFALVENFWETGFGMPSFTLLGPTVIRFPFILHSSYPHEILHNWWGNSVFVDYPSGNWCEGLTAYMADHLIQEQRGKGAEYRRGTLQKYRDYVKEGRDFPLAEFRSRHSAATEAVGYGKALMGFHMLRRRFGDDTFRAAMAGFYRSFRGKKASFDDLRGLFERVTEQDLGWFFDPWVHRAGAPVLRVEVDGIDEVEGRFVVNGVLRQVQDGEPYVLDVPLVVQTEQGEVEESARLAGPEGRFSVTLDAAPLLLHVDPRFDLFRLLDPRETPPSIGQIFGEPRILALLPAGAADEARASYRALLEGWQSDAHAIEIKLDREVESLPGDRAIWIVGRENLHAEAQFGPGQVEGLQVSESVVSLGEEKADFDGHSVVVIRRHPENDEKAIGWLVVDPVEAFPGMGRKLPHYGKYSYLAFEGPEPTNVIKGQWTASGSPLLVDLRPPAQRDAPAPPLAAEKRAALAELPPVFSSQAMADHVGYLASPELAGRGLGSPGLRAAADYIAERFREAGLQPGGDDGGWLQRFTVEEGPDGGPVEAFNVIGTIPGKRSDWNGQSVVVGAHYDHLGLGWPDVHQGDEGRVHPGADDNASGVAVLLELARNLADAEKPPRTLVFAAFSGEEAGRLGSRHYVEHSSAHPANRIRGAINLDTVGRLFDKPLSVLGTATADEWQHIFRGCSYVTGVESRNVPEMLDSSDQMSFIERGVPAVQIFTRAHEDYHRPGDTADKVDIAGLVKVATFVKEAVVYLVQREEPLTVKVAGAGEAKPSEAPPGARRRVSFGIVPEFSFPGPGVRAESIVSGSPAERAGLQAGDVLLRIDETEIADLRGFSTTLKSLQPGQSVQATIQRGEEELTLPVTVEAR